MSIVWQASVDTADYVTCTECGTAWETERQAEDCGSEDRLADRYERTCSHCDTVHDTVRDAEACEESCYAEQASDRT
jgi:hypothetical protein